METGTVASFQRTFGFVRPDAGGEDVFVFWRDIALDDDGYRTLEPGDRVTFERGSDPKGRPCAKAVRVLDATEVA